MAGPNYLIGFGQRLARPISIKTGGGEKTFPWTFDDARKRLAPRWKITGAGITALPELACPAGESVVALTLHPSFLARSYYPTNLLRDLNLRSMGSRAQKVILDNSKSPAPLKAARPSSAPELFIAGDRKNLSDFADELPRWRPSSQTQDDLRKVLDIANLDLSRLKPISDGNGDVPLEVVLHASDSEADDYIVDGFREYAEDLGLEIDLDRRLHAGGLCFLPVRAPYEMLEALTQYSFVRVIRRMPSISLNESVLRTAGMPGSFPVKLPKTAALNSDVQVAVFDGGLAPSNILSAWTQALDAHGIGEPVSDLNAHGLAVTSALLFGPLEAKKEPPAPYSRVDHWRVLDKNTQGDDFELMDVLRRILGVLRQRKYDFVSLSIGPDLPIEDDEVHVWTSALDAYLAGANTVLVSACGNSGEMDWESGNARIQPSSDGVNSVGVGAAGTQGPKWTRAPYSAIGPGRSPGYIKPDLLAFGGSDAEPFWLLDHHKPGFSAARMGTSYAAPYALRSGVAIRSHFGNKLSAAAIKALMVHHSTRESQAQREVGWGRMPSNVSELVVCPEGEVTVVYQGNLEPSQFVRFQIPVPLDPFKTSVTIKATFCIFAPVDPEDTLNYTRAGLGVVFRPSTVGPTGRNKEGKIRGVHESETFFRSQAYSSTEIQQRRDAHKWETILRDEQTFKAGTLDKPVFDVEHHARVHGHPAKRRTDIAYALIVTLSSKSEPHLYNRTLAAYPNVLEILHPNIEVPVEI